MEVFPTTYRVEVFANESGEVTIKQEDPVSGEDSIISIPLMHIDAVIDALRAAHDEALG